MGQFKWEGSEGTPLIYWKKNNGQHGFYAKQEFLSEVKAK